MEEQAQYSKLSSISQEQNDSQQSQNQFTCRKLITQKLKDQFLINYTYFQTLSNNNSNSKSKSSIKTNQISKIEVKFRDISKEIREKYSFQMFYNCLPNNFGEEMDKKFQGFFSKKNLFQYPQNKSQKTQKFLSLQQLNKLAAMKLLKKKTQDQKNTYSKIHNEKIQYSNSKQFQKKMEIKVKEAFNQFIKQKLIQQDQILIAESNQLKSLLKRMQQLSQNLSVIKQKMFQQQTQDIILQFKIIHNARKQVLQKVLQMMTVNRSLSQMYQNVQFNSQSGGIQNKKLFRLFENYFNSVYLDQRELLLSMSNSPSMSPNRSIQ